jgi:hypothetical protein
VGAEVLSTAWEAICCEHPDCYLTAEAQRSAWIDVALQGQDSLFIHQETPVTADLH